MKLRKLAKTNASLKHKKFYTYSCGHGLGSLEICSKEVAGTGRKIRQIFFVIM